MSAPQVQFVHFRFPDATQSVNDEMNFHGVLWHDFMSPPAFNVPLVPPDHQWPAFDSVIMYSPPSDSSSSSSCQSSPSPKAGDDSLPDIDLHQYISTFPSSAELASMPIPPSRGTSRNKSPNHVPRPRNAFMLFRSAFAAAQKISTNIEHDNRHITRIIAHCWNRLSEADKQVWRDKAAAEKAQHTAKYPNYRFSPVGRARKPVKRNVRRNGMEDKKRCEKVAELLLAGKKGSELEIAVKQIDVSLSIEASERTRKEASVAAEMSPDNWKASQGDSDDGEIQPFLSPLLPPAEPRSLPAEPVVHDQADDVVQLCHTHDYHFAHIPSVDNGVLHTPWEYYPIEDGIQSLHSTLTTNQYEPSMNYTNQGTPDFSGFSWSDDSFSCVSRSSSYL